MGKRHGGTVGKPIYTACDHADCSGINLKLARVRDEKVTPCMLALYCVLYILTNSVCH